MKHLTSAVLIIVFLMSTTVISYAQEYNQLSTTQKLVMDYFKKGGEFEEKVKSYRSSIRSIPDIFEQDLQAITGEKVVDIWGEAHYLKAEYIFAVGESCSVLINIRREPFEPFEVAYRAVECYLPLGTQIKTEDYYGYSKGYHIYPFIHRNQPGKLVLRFISGEYDPPQWQILTL